MKKPNQKDQKYFAGHIFLDQSFLNDTDIYVSLIESQLKEVKREGEAWSLIEVLKKLILSADILLIKKDYDGCYHEEIKESKDVAELILTNLKTNKK